MNRLKGRIDKLSNKIKPLPPVFVLMPGQELTEGQKLEAARAEAAGVKPLIIEIVRASKCLKTE